MSIIKNKTVRKRTKTKNFIMICLNQHKLCKKVVFLKETEVDQDLLKLQELTVRILEPQLRYFILKTESLILMKCRKQTKSSLCQESLSKIKTICTKRYTDSNQIIHFKKIIPKDRKNRTMINILAFIKSIIR